MSSSKDAPPVVNAVAQFFERYVVQQLLSEDPGRKTFLAQDRTTGSPVVLKSLTFSQDFSWQALKLFQREAEILQQLNHPALPQYLDSFEFETARAKGIGLVQSYIEARSLQEHLQAGRSFSEAELQDIATQLLDILSYTHSLGIIHRDLKPSNILLSDDRSAHSAGQVYLIDFGSMQNLAAVQGGTMTVVGTYGYMPPEQFGGKAVPASDLYSLGATLIYLLTGCHPADLPQEELRLQFKDRLQLEEGVSDRWLPWLQQLVEPEIAQRFQSAERAKAVLLEKMAIADTLALSGFSSYPPPPPASAMQLILDGHQTLTLKLPRRRVLIQLDTATKPHPFKALAVWVWALILSNLTISTLVTIGLAVMAPALPLRLVLWPIHNLSAVLVILWQTGLGMVALVLGIVGLHLGIDHLKQHQTQSKREKSTTQISINATELLLSNCPSQRVLQRIHPQSDYKFRRHHLWSLRQETQASRLILMARDYNLVIRAREGELEWLAGVLSQALQLPIEGADLETNLGIGED